MTRLKKMSGTPYLQVYPSPVRLSLAGYWGSVGRSEVAWRGVTGRKLLVLGQRSVKEYLAILLYFDPHDCLRMAQAFLSFLLLR